MESYIEANEAARDRLQKTVEHLSDRDLSRELENGWTISATLAHLAFWDRVRHQGWELFEQGKVQASQITTVDPQDLINDATLPQWLALPPREAVRLALEAAEAIDRKIQSLAPNLVQAYLAQGSEHPMLDRSHHRHSHLDQIDQALQRASG
jgi:hypothetical protein